MAKLSPVFNDQTIDANGDPYVGAQLSTYAAGSSTKQPVYTDAAGTIPHSNPIILDSLGFPEQGPIWIPEGISVKFVLAPPTDTDPPTSPIKTIDNVQGVNDASVSISEWQPSGVLPTYISTVSFSLPGDQATEFQKGRRAQFTTSGGTKYGKIINSVFTTMTTVTMLMDGTDVLDSGLSVVNLSLLRPTPSALPNPIELLRSAVVGNATLTPTWDYAYGEIQDVSGVITYTAIPDAPRPGATRIWYPAAGAIMTNGGNISVQGNQNATAAAGDKWIINAITTTTFYVEVIKKDGAAVAPSSVPVRQTVLSGPVDTNGLANFGGSTGSTTVTASGTLVPTAANGFSLTQGAINRIGSITNPSWTGLSTNGTMYLYTDIAVDGSCTTGSTTLAPTYRWGGADVTTNNQFTFNIQEMVGKVGNGATATQTYRVFVGEVTVAGGVVTVITWYALMGRYVAADQAAPGIAGLATFTHNIGQTLVRPEAYLRNVTADAGFVTGDIIQATGNSNSTTVFLPPWSVTGRNSAQIRGGNGSASGFILANKGTGAAANITTANWNIFMVITRAW